MVKPYVRKLVHLNRNLLSVYYTLEPILVVIFVLTLQWVDRYERVKVTSTVYECTKVLGTWKGHYRVKKILVSCMKPWTEAKKINICNITPDLHTNSLILKCEPKSGLSCRGQVVHPRPQTPQGESVAKPDTPLLIILSIACKWSPWQHVQSVIRKAKSVDKNIIGKWLKIGTASQT